MGPFHQGSISNLVLCSFIRKVPIQGMSTRGDFLLGKFMHHVFIHRSRRYSCRQLHSHALHAR